MDIILATVFPASDHWVNLTKYKQGATEPDVKTMKMLQYHAGWGHVDVLITEVKRITEKVTMRQFDDTSRTYLDDMMAESTNAPGSALFGLVGIGKHMMFYKKVLIPESKLIPLLDKPLHWWDDYTVSQQWCAYFKSHIPTMPPALAAAPRSALAATLT